MGDHDMTELVAVGLAGCALVLLSLVADMLAEPEPVAYPADWTTMTYAAGADTAPRYPSDDE